MLLSDDTISARLQALVDRLASRRKIPHVVLGRVER